MAGGDQAGAAGGVLRGGAEVLAALLRPAAARLSSAEACDPLVRGPIGLDLSYGYLLFMVRR